MVIQRCEHAQPCHVCLCIAISLAVALTVAAGELAVEPMSDPGASPRTTPPAEAKLLQPYDMPFWSVDGGGGVSSGGDFALTGSVGQPDAGTATGCALALAGGVWSGGTACGTSLFCDGFESATTGAWSSVTP
jgi:hypothetical protein